MGNASSRRSAQEELQCSLHGAPVRAPALAEATAWAVAMAWREQLHTHVSIGIDPLLQDDFAFVKSYEWITFSVPHDHVQIARAATTAWFWLSCCAGYSGRENPRFWKRVFSELMRPTPKSAKQQANEKKEQEMHWRGVADATSIVQPDNSITDAIRFFDHPDRLFPRVNMNWRDTSVCKTFLGVEQPSSPRDDTCDATLQALFTQLQPFMLVGRLQRPVQVRVNTGTPLSRVEIDELTATAPPPSPPSHGVMMAAAVAPRFLLSSVVVSSFHSVPSVDEQKALFCHETVQFVLSDWSEFVGIDKSLSQAQYAIRLRALFGLDDHHIIKRSIDTFKASRTDLGPRDLAAICSILPHSQSVRTWRFLPSEGPGWKAPRVRKFEEMDWAWLGYALFHPDTESSSSMWRNLDIYLEDITPEAVQILRSMAMGNCFCSVEKKESSSASSNSYYHMATLCERTDIHSEPTPDAEVLLTIQGSSSFCSHKTQVCLCVDDPSSLGTWVRVVAPGVGFGWILASSIVEIVSRPPGKPSLQCLRLRSSWATTKTDLITSFVALVGGNLKTLDLASGGSGRLGHGPSFDAKQLGQMLMKCPVLTSLCVIHDGSLWHKKERTENHHDLPLLEQLWLIVPETQFHSPATDFSLQNLLVLRVTALSEQFRFQKSNRQSIVGFLESHPKLQYFHWSDGHCRAANKEQPNGMFPYVDGRQRTHQHLGHGLSTRALCHFFAPFSGECRLAFLSVVSCARDATKQQQQRPGTDTTVGLLPAALGRMEQDIAVQIFAFATSVAPRELWVGGH